MSKYFLFFILLVLSNSARAEENSCEVKGYSIGFFNGVKTTSKNAQLGRDSLKYAINVFTYNNEKVDYQLFYNDSRVKESDLFILVDLAETFDQRTKELDITSDAKWEAFWDIISERNNSGILNRIYNAVPDFLDFIRSEFNSYINAKIRNFLYELSGSFGLGLPNTEEVTMKHNLINDSLTWQGKKLIYIAHSQGNLWVNQAYNNVLQQQGYSTDNIKVIHIAPASTDVNGDYILSTNDEVINGLRIAVGEVMWPNITAEETENDSLGHGLTEVYLADPDTKEMILKSVNNAFASLVKPEVEDYLFQIEYSEGSDFYEAFEFIDIGFVEPIPELLDSSWFWFYSAYDRLGFVSDNKKLSYDWNEEDKLIDIIQCENPHAISKYAISDLFILKEGIWSGEYIRFDDVSISVKAYDRFGYRYDDVTNYINYIPYSLSRYVELSFSQEELYTQEQKEYLSQMGLTGKYKLDVTPYYFGSMLID